MRAWTCCLLLVLGACSLGDDSADGARGQCAEGGALNDTCANDLLTPAQACWRAVECGAIPLHRDEEYRDDWDHCMRDIDEAGDVQARLIIACISASTCDQLKLGYDACIAFGAN